VVSLTQYWKMMWLQADFLRLASFCFGQPQDRIVCKDRNKLADSLPTSFRDLFDHNHKPNSPYVLGLTAQDILACGDDGQGECNDDDETYKEALANLKSTFLGDKVDHSDKETYDTDDEDTYLTFFGGGATLSMTHTDTSQTDGARMAYTMAVDMTDQQKAKFDVDINIFIEVAFHTEDELNTGLGLDVHHDQM